MTKNILQHLQHNIKNLKNIDQWLMYSFEICQPLDPHQNDPKTQDAFEVLTSRFARAVDILIDKVFRGIDILELENPGTIIDVINRAHKRGIIESAEQFKIYKDLRNNIVHEYQELGLHEIFVLVKEYTPFILLAINTTLDYLKKYV